MDKIVKWAVDNYGCTVESFFEIKQETGTDFYYSINTVILHIKNGYDISIVGYSGTDHDDLFAISSLNTQSASVNSYNERASQSEIEDIFKKTANYSVIDPISNMLKYEKEINRVLNEQYEILRNVRPMIPVDILEIEAAESVVQSGFRP